MLIILCYEVALIPSNVFPRNIFLYDYFFLFLIFCKSKKKNKETNKEKRERKKKQICSSLNKGPKL